ncbi:MAG: hypothetical protein HDR72_03960 [Ruminococcaceae bacterium]|nr:hypothetical protein [Oscillospiraceae bacterium]
MENVTNKTVILNGREVKLSDYDGDNVEIHNFGNSMVYASKFPNIAADADNVIAVSPGAIDGLAGAHGSVYLLGTGKVQVTFTDEKITKTAVAAQSTGNSDVTGVSQEYVDEKDSETLVSAKEYTDSMDAETLSAAKDYADALSSGLSGYIGYTDNDIYGLEADFENNKFIRLAGAVGKNAGADFDGVRAYGGRRRCNLSDSGEVLAYYGDENFKADGSNGQVMVEQPRFYYKVVPLRTEKIDGADGYHLRKARYYISDTPKAGFKVHPAFVRNGVETDRIYLSAFEGCIYDVSAGAYLLNDEQFADYNADKLSSIAEAKPCSGLTQSLTRANARKLAHNRGNGWEQATIQTVSATQLLFIVEYAAFNSQVMLGYGATLKPDDGRTNMAENTGATLDLGNSSGTSINTNKIQIVSYRGEENPWGNIGKWIDGINVLNPSTWSTSQNPGNLSGTIFAADNNFSDNSNDYPYQKTGIPSVYGAGYISAFGYSELFDWIFVPTGFGGNSAVPIGDAFWNKNNLGRGAFINGIWNENNGSGLFALGFNYMPSSSVRVIGARLCFIPSK